MVEVRRQRVATGKEGRLALVEFGIGEDEVVRAQANQDMGPGGSDMGQPGLHRVDAARRVEHVIEHLAISQPREFGIGAGAGDHAAVEGEAGRRGRQTLRAAIAQGNGAGSRDLNDMLISYMQMNF